MSDDNKVEALHMQPFPENPTLEQAVQMFAHHSCPMPLRRQALSILIGEKFLPKQADDPVVESGLWRLLQTAQAKSEASPVDRLMALAECVRFGQVVKRMAPMIATQLQPVFVNPLPALGMLADADDRLNVARACSAAPRGLPWLVWWLAQAIAEEETGEKARSEMLSSLLSRSESLQQAIELLVKAFSELRPATELPGDSLARRLTRTLAILRSLILESEMPAGNGLGNALFELLVMPMDAVGKPDTEKVRLDLCEEALLTVHDAVRSRVSLVTDAQLYQVLAYCKRLCGGRAWPKQLDRPRRRLVADVSEALLLLGKQGRRDQPLLEQFSVLADSTQDAKAMAQALAYSHPELPEDVRDWLVHGRVRHLAQASVSVHEFASSNADGVLGLALGIGRSLGDLSQSIRQPLLDALEIYEPSLIYGTQQLFDKVRALTVLVDQVCGLRQLALHGELGQEVQFSVKFFDLADGAEPRQRMLVKQPAVVRLRPDRSPGEVLVRGLLE